MSGLHLALLIVSLVLASYFSALNLALVAVSPSHLQRRLDQRGRGPVGPWILQETVALEQSVAFLRTFGRLGALAVVIVAIHVRDPEGDLAMQAILGLVIAAPIVWLTTSVVAGAAARHAPAWIIVRSVPVLRACWVFSWPLVRSVRFVDEAVRRIAGAEEGAVHAERELLQTIEDTQRAGGVDETIATMMENVVALKGTLVSEVMTPRTAIEGLPYTSDLQVIRQFILGAGHSRIPVYRESLDAIIGILYVKDLVRYLGDETEDFDLSRLLRVPVRVPETKPVRELLLEFQRSEVHQAIVVDEFGGTAGLVTIEDVLEEIVGEIIDEHEPEHEVIASMTGDAVAGWTVDGRYRVDDFNRETGLSLPEDEDYDTVAGFLLSSLGRVPAAGESVDSHGATFAVIDASPAAIRSVTVRLKAQPNSSPRKVLAR
ncbi:MAG: HlyC/CorC family transporter [Planctomycetes bacterium]|nr:HlyC/CorC family transporter [Planctomycetota bacterium]